MKGNIRVALLALALGCGAFQSALAGVSYGSPFATHVAENVPAQQQSFVDLLAGCQRKVNAAGNPVMKSRVNSQCDADWAALVNGNIRLVKWRLFPTYMDDNWNGGLMVRFSGKMRYTRQMTVSGKPQEVPTAMEFVLKAADAVKPDDAVFEQIISVAMSQPVEVTAEIVSFPRDGRFDELNSFVFEVRFLEVRPVAP